MELGRPSATGARPVRRYPELLLLPQHETLLVASAISPEVAAARGYRSVDRKVMLRRLGFGPSQLAAPALVLPVWSAVTGEVAFSQVRPDDPRVTVGGRIAKYETPAKITMALDAHPFVRPYLGDPSHRLWITEGVRKADAAISRGLCCVALLGVWNWRGTNGAGGRTALADWEVIALNKREVFIVFDSDVMLKLEVHAACDRLGRFLGARGAKVQFVYLPQDGARKVGLDDFLAGGHSVEELRALASDELRPPTPSGPAPVLADLLADAVAFLRRFVAFASLHQATACALWAAHTHVYDRFDVSPFLHVSSPEKRSGKTRLLEALELLVREPWRVVAPSEAVLFRKIDAEHPTLLLDEVDSIFTRGRDDAHEPLRALLNAGNRRGATIPRCVGDGTEIRLAEFDIFAPRVLAGIGALPDTVEDRSVPIRLQRRAPHEAVERFRFRDAAGEAEPTRCGLERWALAAGDTLERSRPDMPKALHDRASEIWEPLLAIADLAGGMWPAGARESAAALHGDPLDQETVGVALLRGIRDAFAEAEVDRLTTADLLGALVDRDDGPWAEWWGKVVKENEVQGPAARLSKLLRPYGITPKTIRLDDGRTPKGYVLADFEEGFRRYVPSFPIESRHAATTLGNEGPAGQNEVATDPPCGDLRIARRALGEKACGAVATLDAPEGGADASKGADGDPKGRTPRPQNREARTPITEEGAEASPDPLVAEAVRRFGNPVVEIRSPDGSRQVVDDDEGQRVWLRAMAPERETWIAQASPAEIAAAVEAALADERGTAPA